MLEAIQLAPDHAPICPSVRCCASPTARGAIAEREQALAIDQNLAGAHGAIAAFKADVGRAVTEAYVREALRLSPRDSSAFHWLIFVGGANLVLGMKKRSSGWNDPSKQTATTL